MAWSGPRRAPSLQELRKGEIGLMQQVGLSVWERRQAGWQDGFLSNKLFVWQQRRKAHEREGGLGHRGREGEGEGNDGAAAEKHKRGLGGRTSPGCNSLLQNYQARATCKPSLGHACCCRALDVAEAAEKLKLDKAAVLAALADVGGAGEAPVSVGIDVFVSMLCSLVRHARACRQGTRRWRAPWHGCPLTCRWRVPFSFHVHLDPCALGRLA
eukprot:341399-Chlamydomonas_euryale.AAC.1